jgi:hypothetical protein
MISKEIYRSQFSPVQDAKDSTSTEEAEDNERLERNA